MAYFVLDEIYDSAVYQTATNYGSVDYPSATNSAALCVIHERNLPLTNISFYVTGFAQSLRERTKNVLVSGAPGR